MTLSTLNSQLSTFAAAAFCILNSAFGASAFAQPLDSAYHDNAEILSELQRYADAYPDWMTLDSIGHSAEYGLPIWCVKISDNPRNIEPEAALLFVGQVHAEEVVGIELALEIMKQMLDRNEENLFRQRLEGLEIYIIPTANPEGLDIVHSGQDITYRKNCRDNVGDGVLRISDREGWDTSGVDINRNFGTHWDRGDTLYRPEATFRYNAYRGSAPFSEPESRALRDLALSRPFLYSIVYHSSRSGANTELLIGPWYWAQNEVIKRPPDAPAINMLGETLADLMPVQFGPDTTYWYGQSTQRKGQLQDWFYVETGCIQYMAEIAADIHPDEEGMRQVVSEQLPAVWFLMDLALGLEGLDGFGTLTVIATDAETGEPIEAKVEIDDETHPILTPRKPQRLTGRFDWLLPEGSHDIILSHLGYNQMEERILITERERTVVEVELSPEPLNQPVFIVIDSAGNPLHARIQIQELRAEDIFDFEDGLIESADLPPGNYLSLTTKDGFIPTLVPFHLTPEQMLVVGVGLSNGIPTYNESFDAAQDYPHSGNGWGITSFDGRSCLTESVSGDYPTNVDLWLTLPDIVRLDTALATMRIVHLPYCEPQDDYQQIEWWTNPDHIQTKRYSQLRKDWDTLYVSLDSLERGDLSLRFRTVSDDAIGEDGWLIDEVAVFVEDHNNAVNEPSFQLSTYNLQLHPNPFNSSTTISFSVPPTLTGGEKGEVSLRIYDLSGRLVAELVDGKLAAGEHKAVWDAGGLAAGIYVVKLESAELAASQKILLLR